MTNQDLADLTQKYIDDGNYVHRVRQGYKTIRWCKDNDPAHEPRATFGAFNKTNPHTKRRWSYHENK